MSADLLEGRHALAEALSANMPVACVYVSKAARSDKRVAGLLKRAEKRGADIVTATQQQLDEHSEHGAHQGVIARVKPFAYASAKDLVDRAQGQENALIIVCDHITDAGNLGAIVRTAEVVGACGVLIPNKRSAQVTTTTYKTSAGAVAHLPIAREANIANTLKRFKDEGFWVIGASEHAEELLWDAPMSGRIVLVMGSEEQGLSRLTLETCDVLVKLPQAGKVESLNVAQATTALAYEWLRQCRG